MPTPADATLPDLAASGVCPVDEGGLAGVSPFGDGESIPKNFALSPVEPRARMKREQLDRWAAQYGTEHRQLRRWLHQGEAKDDPCPLGDPHLMPAWWARNMRHQVPTKILAAARACPAPVVNPAPDPATKVSEPLGDPDHARVVLGAMAFVDGDEVRQAARLVQAAYERLEAAYAGGGGDVDLLQRRWEKAQDALRKAKVQEEEMLKRRRELISRSAVQRDHDTACELLRQMRGSMVRQVLELCPLLDPPQREQLTVAIASVREKEERVFRNLESMKQPADVLLLLAS